MELSVGQLDTLEELLHARLRDVQEGREELYREQKREQESNKRALQEELRREEERRLEEDLRTIGLR